MITLQGGPKIVGNGLVLYLDPGSDKSYYDKNGTVIKDISGNANDSTLVNFGAQTKWDSNSGTIIFDGSDDWISTPVLNTTWSTSAFTVMGFFKWPTGGSGFNAGWFELTPSTSAGWGISCVPRPGKFYIYWVNESLSLIGGNFVNNDAIKDNQFLSMAVSYNGIGGNDQSVIYSNTKIYINGALQTNVSGGVANVAKDGRLYVGGRQYRFYGNMGNFLYYNRTLSSDEILQNHNALKTRFGI